MFLSRSMVILTVACLSPVVSMAISADDSIKEHDAVNDTITALKDSSVEYIDYEPAVISAGNLAVSSSLDKFNSSKQSLLTTKMSMQTKNGLEQGEFMTPYSNPLLQEISLYDPLAHRVYPKLPDTISVGSELDYLKPNPVFMPLVFGLVKPVFSLSWKEEPATSLLFNSEVTAHLLSEMASYQYVNRIIQKQLYQWEATYIRHIRYSVKDLPKPEELVYQLDKKKPVVMDRSF